MDYLYPEGATPLDADEAAGLLLTHITNRGELNRWEQENIMEGEAWAFGRKQKDILTEDFILLLHRKMFGNVWRWAGSRRKSGKNIGVPWGEISVALRHLCDDVAGWIKYKSYPPDEIAARFHHRLVAIHVFPNGNGRHSRIIADLLLVQVLEQPPFTWGSDNLITENGCRKRYIDALRAADHYDYKLLLMFVRS